DRCEGPGIAALEPGTVLETLRASLERWSTAAGSDVYLCGMVGSRNGLVEVPYGRAPLGVRAWSDACHRSRAGDMTVTIAPGVQGPNFSAVPDVMRGEETQVFGAFQLNPHLQQGRRLLVLPGTHSKWVAVEEGNIVRFHTFIPGELFAVLSSHSSLLRVPASAATAADSADSDAGFAEGLQRAARTDLPAGLFQTRSIQLVKGRSAAWGRGFLSGLL